MIRKLFLLIRVVMVCSFLSYLILIDQKYFKNITRFGWFFLDVTIASSENFRRINFFFLVCIINSLSWLTHNSSTRSLFIITISFPITAPSLLNLKFSAYLLLLLLHSLNPNSNQNRSSGSLAESMNRFNPGSSLPMSINLNRTVFLHSMPKR